MSDHFFKEGAFHFPTGRQDYPHLVIHPGGLRRVLRGKLAAADLVRPGAWCATVIREQEGWIYWHASAVMSECDMRLRVSFPRRLQAAMMV